MTLSAQQGLTCPSPGCLAHHHPRSIPDHRPPKRKSITHQIRLIKSSFVLSPPTITLRIPFIHSPYPGYLPPLRSLSSSPCSDGTGFVLEPRTLHLHATRYTGTTDRSDTQGPNLPQYLLTLNGTTKRRLVVPLSSSPSSRLAAPCYATPNPPRLGRISIRFRQSTRTRVWQSKLDQRPTETAQPPSGFRIYDPSSSEQDHHHQPYNQSDLGIGSWSNETEHQQDPAWLAVFFVGARLITPE